MNNGTNRYVNIYVNSNGRMRDYFIPYGFISICAPHYENVNAISKTSIFENSKERKTQTKGEE